MNKNFLEAFNWKKPIIGMLHLKGNTDEDRVWSRYDKY